VGDVLYVTCDGCDLAQQEDVGCGMRIRVTLCACHRCRKLVTFEERAFEPPAVDAGPPRCPSCGGPVEAFDIGEVPSNEHIVIGSCPSCGSSLRAIEVGLWD
jgi:hypothetical protein